MTDFDDKLNSLLSNPAAMEQIMQLAQSLGGSSQNEAPPPPPQAPPPPSASMPDLSALLGGGMGGFDLSSIAKFLPLLQAMNNQDSNARPLLLALRPYLKAERQGKVEQALQLARLFCVGKEFLARREE